MTEQGNLDAELAAVAVKLSGALHSLPALDILRREARRLAWRGFDDDAIMEGLCKLASHVANREAVTHYVTAGLAERNCAPAEDDEPTLASLVAPTAGPSLDVLCLADVTPQATEWLWPNWIPIGKVSCIAGHGGKGKSTILCDIAARVSRGDGWPDGALAAGAGNVLILTAQDDVEDTLAPRLIAAGADMRRVFILRATSNDDEPRHSFALAAHLAQLAAEIAQREGVRLVIVDPITSYLGHGHAWRSHDARTLMEALAEVAARRRVAVVASLHLSQRGAVAGDASGAGSAMIRQARAAFIVTTDAADPERLLLLPTKLSVAPLGHGLACRIERAVVDAGGRGIATSRIAWESAAVTISADDALVAHERADVPSAKAEAIAFLRDLLGNGEIAANDIDHAARKAGIADKPLRAARASLGARSRRRGFGPGATYYWSLPDTMDGHARHGCPPPKVRIHNPGVRS